MCSPFTQTSKKITFKVYLDKEKLPGEVLIRSNRQVESSQYARKGEAEQIPDFLVLAKQAQPMISTVHWS